MIGPELMARILSDYPLEPDGIHGVSHWARVLENGLLLAASTGADPRVVELFAVFHDSRRFGDGRDRGHGRRGGANAAGMRGTAFELDDAAFALLFRACALHTGGRHDEDVTVLTCWDADRLDLGRVGIRPDPRLLCTSAARNPGTIEWALRRSAADLTPALVADQWGIDLRRPISRS